MLTINSNDSEVLRDIADFQQQLFHMESALEPVLDRMSGAGRELIRIRVQLSGEAADGTVMRTSSRNAIGAYGQQHGKARQKRGLQTRYIDAYYTGEMWRDWDEISSRPGGRLIGFRSEASRDKADWLEQSQGRDIFIPSDAEEEEVLEVGERQLLRELKIT